MPNYIQYYLSDMPLTLTTESSAVISDLYGPISALDYSLFADLPDGVFVTPLPAALPLLASGLGLMGLLAAWGKKRKAAAEALAVA